MRGYSHALTGAAVWGTATSTSALAFGVGEAVPALVASGMVLTAGFALAPDSDHHSGTIAYSLPPVKVGPWTLLPSPTKLLCVAVAAISGGHRHATHSWVGIAAMTALTYLIGLIQVTDDAGVTRHYGSGLVAMLAVAFAVKALGWSREAAGAISGRSVAARAARAVLRSGAGPWLFALITVIPTRAGYEWPWLWLMMGIGCTVHVLGDTLTTGGAPWLWPLNPKPPANPGALKSIWYRNGYFALPILGNTTSTREAVFAGVVGLYVGYLLLFSLLRIAGVAAVP